MLLYIIYISKTFQNHFPIETSTNQPGQAVPTLGVDAVAGTATCAYAPS